MYGKELIHTVHWAPSIMILLPLKFALINTNMKFTDDIKSLRTTVLSQSVKERVTYGDATHPEIFMCSFDMLRCQLSSWGDEQQHVC